MDDTEAMDAIADVMSGDWSHDTLDAAIAWIVRQTDREIYLPKESEE